MNPNRRIALNVVATYGRSLYALVAGLFTARWVLMTLGEVDFGLYGVVGGLAAFVTFLNGLLATAVGRFYAFAVGEARKPGRAEAGLEECRRWFNAAVFLHTLVPLALIAIGYPAGEWVVRHYLTIPPDRVAACVWVWRWVSVTCFVSMVNVPYQAMYTAKQNIAELTIYSFVTTTLNVCVLGYMVNHPADWLTRYAAWMMAMSVLPQLIIGFRAHVIYPEGRFRRDYFCQWKYLKPILSFSGFRLLNGAAMIAVNQGQAVVVNKYLGPAANAAMTVGNQVAAQSQTLAAAFAGAFYPAITNAAGEGRLDEMRTLALRTSKFATCALLVFVVPLALEIEPVLKLWLVNPPAASATLCLCILIALVMDKLTEGHWMAVFAVGRIGGYQLVSCLPSFFALALGWWLVARDYGVVGVGYGLVASKVFTNVVRLGFGRSVAGLSPRKTVQQVFLPIAGAVVPALLAGWGARAAGLAQGAWLGSGKVGALAEIVLVSGLCEIVFLALAFLWVLKADERTVVLDKVRRVLGRWRDSGLTT